MNPMEVGVLEFGVGSSETRVPKKKGAFSCSFAPFIWHLSKRKLFGGKREKVSFPGVTRSCAKSFPVTYRREKTQKQGHNSTENSAHKFQMPLYLAAMLRLEASYTLFSPSFWMV